MCGGSSPSSSRSRSSALPPPLSAYCRLFSDPPARLKEAPGISAVVFIRFVVHTVIVESRHLTIDLAA